MLNQENNDAFTSSIFRLIGYGFLIYAIFDIVSILYPFQGLNAPWAFRTIGEIVERVPMPLLGFILVFAGEMNLRRKWERGVLKLLSWGTLIIGILFLVLIPVLLSVTMRMNSQIEAQVNAQTTQQLNRLQQIQRQVDQASVQDLTTLLRTLNQQGNLPAGVNDPQTFRTQLQAELDQANKAVKTQSDSARNDQRSNIMENAVKWSAGSFLSSLLFILMWRMTGWARFKRRAKLRTASMQS